MTVFYFVRHAAHGLLGHRIAGRMPGVKLNPEGIAQAARLADRLASAPISAIYSSPLQRARESAEPLANKLALGIEVSPALDELDFGDWTGLTLEELRQIPEWAFFNSFRSGTRAPNGETMLEAQARITGFLQRTTDGHPQGHVAVFGHGDVIKSALAYYLGVPLDLFQRIEISPASVSIVELRPWGPQVVCINEVESRSWPR